MNNKRIRIIIGALFLAFFIVCLGVITVLISNCIRNYTKYDEDNLTLSHQELTFEKCEEQPSRGGWYLVFFFKEYEKPFSIFTVTSKAINIENLKLLSEGDILDVIFCEEFENICGISYNDIEILSVSDYAKANQNNQRLGVVCCIGAYLCFLFLIWGFIRGLVPSTDNDGLGKIRIEYVVKGNIIRIYHSRHMCSLVINGQIFDQHRGVYGANYSLKGNIVKMKAAENTIRIEAKMGFSHMYLYCNGQLVAKKFLAFG